MKVIAIIPARMASTRFPGKPLAAILGLPMIEHVRRRVALCPDIDDVVVATCDQEIMKTVVENGGQAIMTSGDHVRCTDRVEEAARSMDADVIVNVQGDEPLVNPEMFVPLFAPLRKEAQLLCTNLMAEIETEEEFMSTDVVKTVCDSNENALYFSREPIPTIRMGGYHNLKKLKQLGVIAFRKDFLHRFAEMPQTPLEEVESVDMLRAVENSYQVRMVLSPFQVVGVDTPSDLERATSLMKKDMLFGTY